MAKRRPTPRPIELPSADELPIVHDNSDFHLTDEVVASSGKSGVGAVMVHHLVTFLQVVLVVALGTWSYMTFREANFITRTSAAERAALEPNIMDGQIQRIEFALSVHYALHEKYPPTLEVLVSEGFLESSDLTYPTNRPVYQYQRFGEGFRLYAAEDDTVDSADDTPLIFEE